MQILSPHIGVSEAVSSDSSPAKSSRAERLLTPNVVQLDTRAFNAKPSERTFLTIGIYGFLISALIISAVLVASWVYLPGIFADKEAGTSDQMITSLPPTATLEVSGVKLRKISVNGNNIALVSGYIINRFGNKLPIPQLNIVLRQKDGQNVISWRYRSQQAFLRAGASLRFASKYSTDVKDGGVVEIQFVSGNDRNSAIR
ncbi:MAG: hypothetical protein QM488_17980 [Rhizobiaceae bacterium]